MKILLDVLLEKNQQIDPLFLQNKFRPFDTLIYAGCGRLENFSKWKNLASSLHFVDADDGVAEINREVIGKSHGANYYHALLWNNEEKVVYREHNFSQFNGIKKWVDSKQRFPNVRETTQKIVTSIGLEDMILPENKKEIILILDLNGAESEWLQLQDNHFLELVHQLWVVLPPDFCFENASNIDSLVNWAQVNWWSLCFSETVNDSKKVFCFIPNYFARNFFDDQRKTINRLHREHEEKINSIVLQNQKEFSALEISFSHREREKLEEQKKQIKEEMDGLIAQQDFLKKENIKLQEIVEVLKAERQMIGQRQALLNQELLKGQAQIELIKDLLLKGGSQ